MYLKSNNKSFEYFAEMLDNLTGKKRKKKRYFVLLAWECVYANKIKMSLFLPIFFMKYGDEFIKQYLSQII